MKLGQGLAPALVGCLSASGAAIQARAGHIFWMEDAVQFFFRKLCALASHFTYSSSGFVRLFRDIGSSIVTDHGSERGADCQATLDHLRPLRGCLQSLNALFCEVARNGCQQANRL